MGRALAATLALAALLAACGTQAKPVAAGCAGHGTGAEVIAALRTAPARAALPDGTVLSECVERSTSGADLEGVGGQITSAGLRLSQRAASDPATALRLGYLVGAVERGAARTAGFQAELENRMRSFVEDEAITGPERAALQRGRRAGRRGG